MYDKLTSRLLELNQKATLGRWCTRWGCTTCGSNELTTEMAALEASADSSAISKVLASNASRINLEVLTWMLRFLELKVGHERLSAILNGSVAGQHFALMRISKLEADARRQAHMLRNDPIEVERQREAKKVERAEAHRARLERKRERDAEFWAGRKP
mgnify:CR=1 FL=1